MGVSAAAPKKKLRALSLLSFHTWVLKSLFLSLFFLWNFKRIRLQCCNRKLQHRCCKNIGRLRFYHNFWSHASSFLTQSLLLPLQTKHFLISFTSPSLSLQTRSNFSFLLQQKNYAYETSEISRENFRVKSQQGSEGPNGFEVVLSISISLVKIPSPEHFVFLFLFSIQEINMPWWVKEGIDRFGAYLHIPIKEEATK